jgi:hypothetical protein
MQCFRILTLVDITHTNIFKESLGLLEKKQQDNFQTLHQTLETRAIVFTEQEPKVIIMDWSTLGYSKQERTWEWIISTERDDLYLVGDDPCGGMKQDIEYVPFTLGCTETAEFHTHFFTTLKPTNIIFELIDK